MISTTVKKSLNKIKFYREIELPDFASKKTIPIRHLNIGFEGKEIDVEFYMNNQFATMFFATLSVFLTYGEDLVIETARHHREFIQDPISS
ncbi:metal-dependent hydrolase, partial [Acinetobacter baumannii]